MESAEVTKRRRDFSSQSAKNATNENTFPIPVKKEEKAAKSDCEEAGLTIVNAVRKNTFKELKQAFIVLIYALPHEEELQIRYIHKVIFASGDDAERYLRNDGKTAETVPKLLFEYGESDSKHRR